MFAERLERYKNEEDWFVADIYRGGEKPYETVHDLTWNDVQKILKRCKKNEKVSGVDVLVEDWDGDEMFLFKNVCRLEKKPVRWNVDLATGEFEVVAWS